MKKTSLLKYIRPKNRRLLLVDDHAVVRQGIAELINREPGLEVCGQVGTAPHAVTAVARLHPDLVLLDLSLADGSGMELIKNLKTLHPHLPILVLSVHDENLYARRVLKAGARGYVMKLKDSATVIQAVHTVLKGGVYASPVVNSSMILNLVGNDTVMNNANNAINQLTDRELEVFKLIGRGCTIREIARQLQLSISTVETHRAHIKQKLHLGNSSQLIRLAVESNHGSL